MKAVVDADTCTGCGLCADVWPEVFEIDYDVATVKLNKVPSTSQDAWREAMESCPVDAISIDE